MSEPFVGEVRIFAGNFNPSGWQFCNGQLLSIAENVALFSILGTTYGGNGTTTFALPNLQGCFPMHPGTGSGNAAGLSTVLGQTGGTTSVTIGLSNMPPHGHTLFASTSPATLGSPGPTANLSTPLRSAAPLYTTATPAAALGITAVGTTGSGLPLGRAQPYLALSFIISLFGVFPSRN